MCIDARSEFQSQEVVVSFAHLRGEDFEVVDDVLRGGGSLPNVAVERQWMGETERRHAGLAGLA